MYAQHFHFSDPPFSIAPNPRYIYLSPQHREALAHLLYGISAGGGFVALTGEVGTGKTTLCRCLLEQLPEDVDIALIFNPRLNAKELLASICDELRLSHPAHRASIKLLIDTLNHHLLDAHARGRRTVILIDEAQNLSFDVLEQIRLLTNLETNDTKLLQIILVGQPELLTLLARRNLRQLSQRITARYHLRPLSFGETAAYIRHRIAVSGGRGELFSRLAIFWVYRRSGGIPRLINLICDRALLGAYTRDKMAVSGSVVRKAAREVLPTGHGGRLVSPVTGILATIAALLVAGMFYFDFAPIPDPGSVVKELAAMLAARETGPPRQPNRDAVPQQAVSLGQPEKHEAHAEPGGSVASVPPPQPLIPDTEQPVQSSARAELPDRLELTSATLAPSTLAPPPSGNANTAPADGPGSAAPAESEGDFARRLMQPGLSRSAAFLRLFSLWGLPEPKSNQDTCLLARQDGLRCLFLNGNWLQLKGLDHPAILELVLADGTKRYATLTGLRNDKLVLSLDGHTTETVELTDMLPYWRGSAILLWKPPGDASSIHPGEKGEAVRWLSRQLGVEVKSEQEVYFDDKLKARVITFQLQNGLEPDGVAGPQTMIHLDKKSKDRASPRLGSMPE